MMKLLAVSTLFATSSVAPALAHEGHAELPGAMGHHMAHLLIAGAVLAAALGIRELIRSRRSQDQSAQMRKEE